MQTIRVLPTFPERPTNPARTDLSTGEIEINSARWKQLTPEEREFVLQHEVGHYQLQTFDEVAADRYALQRLAGKKPYSLINYLNAVNEISYSNPQRVSAAQHDTLKIAASRGSKEAQKLLDRYAAADGSEQLQSSNRWIWILAFFGVILTILLFAETLKI